MMSNTTSLGELVNVQTGKLDANASSTDGAYPFFTCAREPLRIAEWKYDLDAILIAGNGDLNVKHYAGKFDAYQRTYILDVKNAEVLNSRFLFHFMDKYVERLREQSIGGIIKYIKLGMLTEAQIPLPPLEEQKRIAGILDQADALRRLRTRALDKLNTLGQAIFHEMFGDPVKNPLGWDTARLGDLCDVGSSKRVFVSEFVNQGVPFYRGTEVGKLGVGEKIEPDLFIAYDHYQSLIQQSGKPETGDLLLPSICHDGRIWKVDSNEPFYFKDGRVLWIKSNAAKINSDYLRNQLRNIFLNNYTSVASGTTFAELKIVNLKNLRVLCPPIDLQILFSNRVQEVAAQQANQHVSAVSFEQLFASFQHRAFRGEL